MGPVRKREKGKEKRGVSQRLREGLIGRRLEKTGGWGGVRQAKEGPTLPAAAAPACCAKNWKRCGCRGCGITIPGSTPAARGTGMPNIPRWEATRPPRGCAPTVVEEVVAACGGGLEGERGDGRGLDGAAEEEEGMGEPPAVFRLGTGGT